MTWWRSSKPRTRESANAFGLSIALPAHPRRDAAGVFKDDMNVILGKMASEVRWQAVKTYFYALKSLVRHVKQAF
jgi:hypothetical protein